MTLFCKVGDKPKVIYRANGDKQDSIFYSEISPIDVTVVPVENPNLPSETYAWNFSTNLNPRTTLADMPFRAKGKLTGFRIDALINTDTINGIQNGNWACSFLDGDGNRLSGSAVGYYPADTPKLVKILIPNPNKPPEDICRLEVKDTSGNLLFSASGKCPINYKVACGNCLQNQCEHKTNNYPGYCCVDCNSVRNKLDSLANKAKRKHG